MIVLVACSRQPTELVVRTGEAEVHVALDKLRDHDVALERGCELGGLPDGKPGALVICNEKATEVRCTEGRVSFVAQGKASMAWCQ